MRTVAGPAPDLRAEAEEAFKLARLEPAAVWARASGAGAVAWDPIRAEPETAAIAQLALGVAAIELHELAAAREALSRARQLALAAGAAGWAAEANANLAFVLASGGELEAALKQLDATDVTATGEPAARAECVRALVLQRLGRVDEALDAYRRGLSGVRRAGDRLSEARVLANRGLLHAYAGRLKTAHAELSRAARLYGQLGRLIEAAYVRHNIGFVATRRGDLPIALQAYDQAAQEMARLGVSHPAALLDYCETLLRASLIDEARQVGRQAVHQLEEAGLETDLAEARLLLAQVALVAGDLQEAEKLAVLAQFSFLAQARHSWAVQARYTWLQVRWASGDRSEETMIAGQALAGDLRRSAWHAAAAHARVLAARIALERGDAELAEAELRAEARHRRRAPVQVRIEAWHAEARLRWSKGDSRGAQSALRAGMQAVSAYRTILGASELRVNAGSQAYELGRLALEIAVACREPEGVLAWAERCRAATIRLGPVRPPTDDELAQRLNELRALNQALEDASAGEVDVASLLRRKASLEDAIRQSTWKATGFRAREHRPPTVRELRRALGWRVLVEYVESEGVLYAVTVCDGRSSLSRIGDVAQVADDVESLRFAVTRLASAQGAKGSQEVMADAFRRAAARLDGTLLGSVAPSQGNRPLVVVPSGPLHQLPWAALPSCQGRAVSVSPSAATWLDAVSRSVAIGGPTVLVAGPGLAHAREELDQLSRIYPGARRLDGRLATAKSVAGALDGAGLAHVVAHGAFRADNPLFSSLRLHDGPLTVYELERLDRAPRRIVLSSCNGGLASVLPNNELLGLSSALFALGTTTLVASLLPVGDGETQRLMVEFHRHLAAGVDAPSALAAAQTWAAEDPTDVRSIASASAFVCIGA